MQRTMRQLPTRMLVLLAALACSAQAAHAQLLPPLQPFEPLQPMQPMQPFKPFKPLAPFPPMAPLPGFPPFPQMPPFPDFGQQAGAAAGRAGGPGTFAGGPGTYSASSTSSSFAGPRASTTPGCTIVQETSGDVQAGAKSCRISQRIEVCNSNKPGSTGHTRAVASINGQPATCCVMLLKLPAKTPQLFCAAPKTGATYMRLPAAGVEVKLKPECSSTTAEGDAGSLACTVTFNQLPEGYTYPEGHTAASPLVIHRGNGSKVATASGPTAPGPSRAGFVPCGNKQFKKFMQATSRTLPSGGVVLTSKCA